jgi:hypothetical protein
MSEPVNKVMRFVAVGRTSEELAVGVLIIN